MPRPCAEIRIGATRFLEPKRRVNFIMPQSKRLSLAGSSRLIAQVLSRVCGPATLLGVDQRQLTRIVPPAIEDVLVAEDLDFYPVLAVKEQLAAICSIGLRSS